MSPPFSERTRYVERIRQTAPDRLESQMTIEDPETLRIDARIGILNAIWAASERWWARVRRQGRYRSKKGPARHGGSRTPSARRFFRRDGAIFAEDWIS
jgi:hypothetical protein